MSQHARSLVAALGLCLATTANGANVAADGAATVQNGAIGVGTVDGGDSVASTSRAANKNTILQRRANDCLAQVDGVFGELCTDDLLYVHMCVPSSGACNTAAEWPLVIAGIRTGTTVPSTCTVGDPIFFDTDAAAGARVNLCLSTNVWIAIDSAFGAEIIPDNLQQTFEPAAGFVLNCLTNGCTFRFNITGTNPGVAGALVIDSTTPYELEWRGHGACSATTTTSCQVDGDCPGVETCVSVVHSTAEYLRMAGHTTSQSILGKITVDGSDNGTLRMAANGLIADTTRGAYLELYGNESGLLGAAILGSGNSVLGVSLATGGTTRMYVDVDGDVCLSTGACTRTLGIDGTAARTLGMETRTGNNAGNGFTVNAGGSGSGSSNNNLNGGDLTLQSGSASGNGSSKMDFAIVDINQGSGSTARTVTTAFRLRDSHQVAMGTVPAVSSCGTTPAIDAASTDAAGKVTFGTGTPTTCTVTFAKAYTTNAPACTVTGDDAARRYAATTSTTVLTITTDASAPSDVVMYLCEGFE